MQIAYEMLLLVQEVFVECSFYHRVFAMYGLNRWILACLVSVGGVFASVALWGTVNVGIPQTISAPGVTGCNIVVLQMSALLLAGAWEAMLVSDTLIFLLTVRRAYIQRRMSPSYGGLLKRMVRDGGMYFGIIVFIHLANLLTFYLGDVLLSGFLSWFTTSISVTLICRLMLNLHEAANVGIETTEPNRINLQTLRFARTARTTDEE